MTWKAEPRFVCEVGPRMHEIARALCERFRDRCVGPFTTRCLSNLTACPGTVAFRVQQVTEAATWLEFNLTIRQLGMFGTPPLPPSIGSA